MNVLDDPHSARIVIVIMIALVLAVLLTLAFYLRAIKRSAEATTARSNTAITELRSLRRMSLQMEVALAAERFAEGRFQKLLSVIREAYVGADETGIIVAWNPAAALMFQRSADEAIGLPLRVLMPARLRSQHEEGFKRFLASRGGSVRPERYLDSVAMDADGDEFAVRIVMWPTELPDSVICNALIHRVVEGEERREIRREGE